MRLLRRGRHAGTRGADLPAILVVAFVLVSGSSIGMASFTLLPAHGPAGIVASTTVAVRPPPPPPRLPELPAPLPGSADMTAIDTAWRDFDDTVDVRFRLTGPVPGDHPPPPPDSGEGRRVVYANAAQRVWLTDDDGTVLDSYAVSGRSGVPRPGTYRVFSKSELAWAGHDGITMHYMVRFTHGSDGLAIGFHSIPVDRHGTPIQTEEDLGDFRSAGCIRQSIEKAVQLYRFADPGTTVVVTP